MNPYPFGRPPANAPNARLPAAPQRDTPDSRDRRPDANLATWTLSDLDRAFTDFLAYMIGTRGHSAASRSWYQNAYKNFRKFLLVAARGRGPLGLRVFAIDEWIAWNRERGLGPVSLHTYWRGLGAFFRNLERRDGLPSPFEGLRPPPLPAQLPKALPPKACRRILEATHELDWPSAFERSRAEALLGMALYAGLRRNELLHLHLGDVNLEAGTIRIVAGKGRGGGKDRTAYIASELAELLDAYLIQRRRRQLLCPEFFASQRPGHGVSVTTLRRLVARVGRASGERFSLHVLRHSFVTHLLRSHVPLHVARDLAGHSKIRTTERYLAVFDEEKERYIQNVSFR